VSPLASIFLRARSTDSIDHDSLERLLASLLARGRTAWPDLALSDEAFVERLGRTIAAGADVASRLGAIAAEDLYLVCACETGVPGAREALVDRFWRRIPAYLASMKPGATDVDDVRSIVWMKLFDRSSSLASYRGGSLSSWLKAIAVRTFLDLRSAGPTLPETDVSGAPPETARIRKWDRSLLFAAIRDVLPALPERERWLLHEHYFLGRPLPEIAASLNMTPVAVRQWLHRTRTAIEAETRRRLEADQGIRSDEFESLVRMLGETFDESLSGLLKKQPRRR
jgi:RNA polymerase sigma-70 factor (ECF subfamily)